MKGWRLLALFWAVIVLAAFGGGAWLDRLGPPAIQAAVAPPVAPAPPPAPVHEVPPAAPVRLADGTVAPPNPVLLEPATDLPNASLPRTGPGGLTASRFYAAAVPATQGRPRLALLVAGYGMSGADSRAALQAMPAAVDFGVSPYAAELEPLLAETRAKGHEILVTLPMESQGYPLNDSGPHALLTGAAPGENDRNLHWVLSRVPGAVGVSGASDGLRGERFAAATTLIAAVQAELQARGLFYLDPRPGAPAPAGGVSVGVVLDEPATRADLDAKLALLEQQARDTGAAIGLMGALRPALVQRAASWAIGLDGRGVALVPLTALLIPRERSTP